MTADVAILAGAANGALFVVHLIMYQNSGSMFNLMGIIVSILAFILVGYFVYIEYMRDSQ